MPRPDLDFDVSEQVTKLLEELYHTLPRNSETRIMVDSCFRIGADTASTYMATICLKTIVDYLKTAFDEKSTKKPRLVEFLLDHMLPAIRNSNLAAQQLEFIDASKVIRDARLQNKDTSELSDKIRKS